MPVIRPPLREAELSRALVVPNRVWSRIEVVAETGSTNADVCARARSGTAEGLVLAAENQYAGRGRQDRTWQSPPRAGLTMSVLLRPGVSPARLGWLALLCGLAVAQACDPYSAVAAALKWPNDLLVRPADTSGSWGKCGGILAETVATPEPPLAVVVGIGINVSQQADELPGLSDPLAYPATSLAMAGAVVDRQALAVAVLDRLADWYERWLTAAGDPVACGLRAAYRGRCLTVGRDVTVALPAGTSLTGRVHDIDLDGRLVVTTAMGRQTVAAGDVAHVR
jgi:BirA family transcriptional regulator, biotin operon repressor / biotin---[acetyl-CoA-carboxylase] ligase